MLQELSQSELLQRIKFLEDRLNEFKNKTQINQFVQSTPSGINMLELVTSHMVDLISIYDSQGRYQYVSPSFKKSLGYDSEDLLGLFAPTLIHPDEQEEKIQQIREVFAGTRPSVEFRYKRKSGEYSWFESTGSYYFDETGTMQGAVMASRNITERKQAEEALSLQNIELKLAKEKAVESDRLKSVFLANLSHEIRTPMNGIMGFADLLKNPDLSGESQLKYIEIIEASSKRMLNIISDLIDISRIESGQTKISIELTPIHMVLNHLVSFFSPEAETKGIQIICNNLLPKENYLFETDKTKLTQIISNLIKNALKFTKQGQIEFGCSKMNDSILFYVKDTGIGIRKELIDKIFSRFDQGDFIHTINHDGLGLGLSISKAYVEILGGLLKVESEPDEGSNFYFTLPYKFTENSKGVESSQPEKPVITIEGLNILIAEDDETSYFLLKEILERQKAEVFYVKNGKEAVDFIEMNPEISVVLMDIKMPIMDGLEATRRIREFNNNVVIIAQSAFAFENDIRVALEAGCNDYLTKPVNKVLLIEKLQKYR